MANPRKSFPLRISQDVFNELKSWADQEMRSINGQIEYLLKEAVRKRRNEAKRDESESDQKNDSQ